MSPCGQKHESKKLTTALKGIGYVCHTIIPELDKYSADNQRGMYPCPISIGTPSYRWITFLSFDTKSASSTLFKACLHSPVDKVTALRKNLKAKEIHCCDGIILLASDSGPIKAIEFTEGSMYMTSKEKNNDLRKLATEFNLSPAGTAAEITSRLKKYSESVKQKYLTRAVPNDEIFFWERETQPSFEAMVVADRDLFYAAEPIEKSIISFQIEKDGVGLKGVNMQAIISYRPSWQKVNSMCLNNGNLFLSHAHGISKINLETCQTSLVVELDNQPCVLTRFGTDILYTNQKKASIWQLSGNGRELRLFAGSDKEDGSMDGPVKECRFKQPMGICAELESVVYVCDAQTNSIKICTKLKECTHFLEATGGLYEAFSMHEKGAHYTVKSAEEAIGLVRQCREMLDENTLNIKEATGIQTALNGPQRHVSARTVASVAMIDTGLQRQHSNLQEFGYNHISLLSCMTLDVEHCHSTIHIKRANMSMAEYCRSFGLTMKEAVKRLTSWTAYYHTSRRSWYPTPDGALLLLQVPVMKPLPVFDVCQSDCDAMRDWASSYGAAVRQRTVRQETTMARHGTLPEFMYQRHCEISENPVSIAFDVGVNAPGPTDDAREELEEDQEDIFDESSDEEVEHSHEGSTLVQGEIGSSATFLLGARTCYGRAIRFNNRLLY